MRYGLASSARVDSSGPGVDSQVCLICEVTDETITIYWGVSRMVEEDLRYIKYVERVMLGDSTRLALRGRGRTVERGGRNGTQPQQQSKTRGIWMYDGDARLTQDPGGLYGLYIAWSS